MAQEQKQSNDSGVSSTNGVIIITGVSAGLGEAMVNEFISKGYTLHCIWLCSSSSQN